MKNLQITLMLNAKISMLVLLFISQFAFSQKKGEIEVRTDQITLPSCKCSELAVYPYLYYRDPANPTTSDLLLRFDFHRKGVAKCKPEFLGNLSIFGNTTISVTFEVKNLVSLTNTEGQRIFIIPRSQITSTFSRFLTGQNFKIVYSLSYGTKSVCPAKSSKLIKFQKSEPIL